MQIKYPCSICKKTDAKKNSVLCDKCNQWVHIITCNKIATYCHKNLQKENTPWYCRQCVGKVVPFLDLTDMQLNRLIKENISSLTNLNKNRSRYYFHTKNFSLQLLVIQCLKNMVNWQMINLPLIYTYTWINLLYPMTLMTKLYYTKLWITFKSNCFFSGWCLRANQQSLSCKPPKLKLYMSLLRQNLKKKNSDLYRSKC